MPGSRLSLCVVAALMLLSCKTVDVYITSGEAIADAGEQFLALNTKIHQLHASHRIDDPTFARWEAFAPQFQETFVKAAQLWQVAFAISDDSLMEKATELLMPLLATLNEFTKTIQVLLRQ